RGGGERRACYLEPVVALAQAGRAAGGMWSHLRPQGGADTAGAVVQATRVDRLVDGQPLPVLPGAAHGGVGRRRPTGRLGVRIRRPPRCPAPARVRRGERKGRQLPLEESEVGSRKCPLPPPSASSGGRDLPPTSLEDKAPLCPPERSEGGRDPPPGG